MYLKIIEKEFAICKIDDIKEVDFSDEFIFFSKTDEEYSLVCTNECIPSNVLEIQRDWKCFRIDQTMDFSLVGIISKISSILSQNKIPIYVVSTFNTDYVLIKSNKFMSAIGFLKENGYKIL